MPRPSGYDSHCLELAEVFIPDTTPNREVLLVQLAGAIQRRIEEVFEEKGIHP